VARRKKVRAWGLTLLLAATFSFFQDQWLAGSVFSGALALYLLFVRKTACRVQTLAGGMPCTFSARGYFGTCKPHTGLKRGLPVVRLLGSFKLPRLMWLRPEGVPPPRRMAGPIAATRELGTAEPPARTGRETVMLWVTISGVVVAVAAFLRDLIAG
jgi:hypothetical protein